MIKPCSCKQEYQDSKYGRGMRVHNKSRSRVSGKDAWTCSCCGKKKD